MRITFTPSAWEDYLWIQENDRKLLKRINLLIRDCARSPFEGIGKPEPLKGELSGHGHGALLKNIVWSIPQPLPN